VVAVIRRPEMMAGWAIWLVLLLAAYWSLPGLRPVTWGLLGVSALAASAAIVLTARALRRERVLRLAGGALASAASLDEIAAAARDAVAELAGRRHGPQTLLTLQNGSYYRGGGTAAAPGPGGETGQSQPPGAPLPPGNGHPPATSAAPGNGQQPAGSAAPGNSQQLGAMVPAAGGETPRAADGDAGHPALSPGRLAELKRAWLIQHAGAGPHLVPPQGPATGLAGEPGGSDSMLLCPIGSGGRQAGPAGPASATGGPGVVPPAAIMAVFGRRKVLARLSATLEILAGQVTVAVERVLQSQEMRRRISEASFLALTQDASDIIMITEDDGTIRCATPSAASMFGEIPAEGARLMDLVRAQDRDTVARSFRRLRDRGDERAPEGWRVTRRDGSPLEAQVRCHDLRADPAIGGLVFTIRDVTMQHALERELRYRSFHDTLTGLPNRLLFQDRIAHALARARQTNTTVSVLLVDLDDFKVVNDSLGHGIGDELLVAAAARLSALLRDSDTAARLGGDEFALLLEEISDTDEVERFAERVVRAFGEPFPLSPGSVVATATVGIATTEDSGDAGDLVRHADLALYAAKAAGKRQWRRYQPVLSIGMAKRRELQAAIDDAVAGSAFTLVYQPIVALASGEISGFEALVRWPHPRWGMINPEQFITLAEETGHIVPLGAWVLERAVTDTVGWQHDLPGAHLYISVNVSARQFANPGFVAAVEQTLSASGLAPAALVLELTESVLLRRDERIWADLTELKRIGVRLAIDDFGTGYSSLGYLRELPVDILKIDKSFVEGITVSEQRMAIVEVIIRIAKTLGLTVTAEGIESEAQRDLLISMGCEYGQGYLLEHPVSADEAKALVRAGGIRQLRRLRLRPSPPRGQAGCGYVRPVPKDRDSSQPPFAAALPQAPEAPDDSDT
jgi:diguanylate cyclase (GGDEF)-like protein/PAS domain S-box-containing protein